MDRQVGDLPYVREQRGAYLLLLLLLLLLLWRCTESETPWTGRSETCPTALSREVRVGNSCLTREAVAVNLGARCFVRLSLFCCCRSAHARYD